MLKSYDSRPCTVLACEIEEQGEISKTKGKAKSYTYSCKHKATGINTLLVFGASEEPKVGDFIIQTSKADIEHCPRDVFEKKYTIARMLIQ